MKIWGKYPPQYFYRQSWQFSYSFYNDTKQTGRIYSHLRSCKPANVVFFFFFPPLFNTTNTFVSYQYCADSFSAPKTDKDKISSCASIILINWELGSIAALPEKLNVLCCVFNGEQWTKKIHDKWIGRYQPMDSCFITQLANMLCALDIN